MTKNKLYWQYTASICLLLFTVIAYFVKSNEAILSGIDEPLIQFIRGSITPSNTKFFLYFTKFGNTVTIVLLTLISVVSFFRMKEKVAAAWLFINAAFIQGAGNVLLKLFFNRPRPTVNRLAEASGTSFPSGHSMGSMLFYGTLILLIPKFITNKPLRYSVQLILGVIILLVGTSRIYLGVHYPTDVLGGFLMGAAWLCFSYPLYQKYDFIQSFEGKKA